MVCGGSSAKFGVRRQRRALDPLAFPEPRIQSGVALRLPPHSKSVFQQPARERLRPGRYARGTDLMSMDAQTNKRELSASNARSLTTFRARP